MSVELNAGHWTKSMILVIELKADYRSEEWSSRQKLAIEPLVSCLQPSYRLATELKTGCSADEWLPSRVMSHKLNTSRIREYLE